jgi:hypothetical protein
VTRSAKQGPPPTGLAGRTAALPDTGLCGKTRGRQTFVLGIFPEPAQADLAIAGFAHSQARDCDVLLVSRVKPPKCTLPRLPAAISPAARRMSWCQSDTFLKAGNAGRNAQAPNSFSTLWKSMHAENAADLRVTPLGTQRLFQDVVRRLSEGAALVIARTETAEQRMASSRALLEADCEVLLTHEMIAPASDATPRLGA